MKKLFLFFTLLAGIAVMTGCKKEQDFVTLKAVIDPDTKAYFGTAVTPYWNADDRVRVMGIGYSTPSNCPLTLSSVDYTCATVLNVPSSPEGYYAAIFPTKAAETMYTPGEDGTTQAVVYFDPHQDYKETTINGVTHQQVDMIMGAVTDDNTKTFYFKNLCSILRLNIVNDLGRTVKLSRITVQATGAYVSGSADVTLTPNGTPEVSLDGLNDHSHDNVLSIYAPKAQDGSRVFMKTLTASGTTCSTSIDVVVPPFDANSLNIELELYEENGTTFIGNSDAIIDNPPSLDINKIVPIDLTTDHRFEDADYAYIEPGPDFYNHMHALLDSITDVGGIINSMAFNVNTGYDVHPYNSSLHVPETVKVVNVKDEFSPFNIWAYLVNTSSNEYTINIVCEVGLVYANKDCSKMFQGLPDLETMNWNNGDLPGFQTEDVVDMSYMFAGCQSLTSIQGANFNTTNVRTMAHMFDGCSSFSSDLNLGGISGFNTHNLQDMAAMFKGCSSLGSLNISNFTTRRVYNMSELFSGCLVLKTVHIDNFDMSSVTNKTNMFQNLGTTYPNWGATIYCTTPTWTAIQTGTGLPSNTLHSPTDPSTGSK